ncbi:MAG: M48 family metallopeptidase [Gammaproteobacteria bacterium]|nr:M48 family metallopeptidase [Gammaproteobacteria bacterium]
MARKMRVGCLSRTLQVGDLRVEILRKPINHCYLRVCPPEGRVRASVPLRMDETAVRQLITERAGWIRCQRARLQARPPAVINQWLSGESHRFQGQVFEFELWERSGSAEVVKQGSKIQLGIRPNATIKQREAAMNEWYRTELKRVLPGLISRWQTTVGEVVSDWGVKRMKTRWGSCNPRARRIWLNLDLIKHPPESLEYVVVHEMIHLLERSHNARFYALMDRYLPDWRLRRDHLNDFPGRLASR